MIAWLPSHVRVQGYDSADWLTRKTATTSDVFQVIPAARCELKPQMLAIDDISLKILDLEQGLLGVASYIKQHSQTKWTAGKQATVYKSLMPKVNDIWNYYPNSRQRMKMANQIRLQTARTNTYLRKLNLSSTEMCKHCHFEWETIVHLVSRCL